MLEVMNVGSTELPHSERESRIILNCWEKTSPLIKELERTVNFAERKCGDLMQQLHFYKEYYEKWVHAERLNRNLFQKKKFKKCCRRELEGESSSENEFEKVNRYFYKKIKSKITEMNQEISQANRKIRNKTEENSAALKNLIEIPPNPEHNAKHEDTHPPDFENKTCKSEPIVSVVEQEFSSANKISQKDSRENIKLTSKQSSKSVPVESLDLKLKKPISVSKSQFSNLQRFKLRSKSLPQGVRRKFGFGGFIEVFDPKTMRLSNGHSKSKTSLKVDSYRSYKTFNSEGQIKSKFIEGKNGFTGRIRRNVPRSARSLQCRITKSKGDCGPATEIQKNYFSKSLKSESGIRENLDNALQNKNTVLQNNVNRKSFNNNSCQDIVPSNNANLASINHLISKPNALIPFLRQPIPFIPCSSTSKTFNLGLNVQQVLSLIKNKRHSITLQTVIRNGMKATRSITNKTEPAVNTLFFSHSQVTSALCPAQTCMEDTFSVITDDIGCRSNCALLKQTQALRTETDEYKNNIGSRLNLNEEDEINKIERPEDVWVVDQPDNNTARCKKSRSRCTCFPSKHCVDYQKVLREYTRWKAPGSKAPSFASENYSSYHPLVACSRSKLCPIPSQENLNCGVQESSKIELVKVHNNLLNLNRKFSDLEEQITHKHIDDYEMNAELDAIESELSVREMELKNIMNSYQELMLLKEKLKILRVKNFNSESQTTINQPRLQRPKKDPLRPTPSMALAKVLRKIQGLQDKIKLMDTP